jgi:hypothetical protein
MGFCHSISQKSLYKRELLCFLRELTSTVPLNFPLTVILTSARNTLNKRSYGDGGRSPRGLWSEDDFKNLQGPASRSGIPFGGGDKHCGRALAALRIPSFRDGDEEEDGKHRNE